MRSLIKNDPGIQYGDEGSMTRSRRRRRSFRLSIAVCSIALAGFFVYQLLSSSTGDVAAGPAVHWNEPKSVVTWLRWSVNAACVELRGTVNGALPSGNMATIFKMCLCFGLGAIFLRMPQRY